MKWYDKCHPPSVFSLSVGKKFIFFHFPLWKFGLFFFCSFDSCERTISNSRVVLPRLFVFLTTIQYSSFFPHKEPKNTNLPILVLTQIQHMYVFVCILRYPFWIFIEKDWSFVYLVKMGTENNYQMKVVKGDYGYVLEDVPHLTDYIPDLPVWFLYLFFLLLLMCFGCLLYLGICGCLIFSFW